MQNVYFPLCATFSCPSYPVLFLTQISYVKQAPYFSPRDLCLDLSMCLRDMWGQRTDHAGVTGALLICQTTGCREK